jgi:hypothetical protein
MIINKHTVLPTYQTKCNQVWYHITARHARALPEAFVHEKPEQYQWNGGNTHDCHSITWVYHIDWALFEPRDTSHSKGMGALYKKVLYFTYSYDILNKGFVWKLKILEKRKYKNDG